jgi:hypothetical protein
MYLCSITKLSNTPQRPKRKQKKSSIQFHEVDKIEIIRVEDVDVWKCSVKCLSH